MLLCYQLGRSEQQRNYTLFGGVNFVVGDGFRSCFELQVVTKMEIRTNVVDVHSGEDSKPAGDVTSVTIVRVGVVGFLAYSSIRRSLLLPSIPFHSGNLVWQICSQITNPFYGAPREKPSPRLWLVAVLSSTLNGVR